MPLTLDQYASHLDTRDLPWPMAPEPAPPKARPHLTPLPGIRAVLWNVYGTLLSISEGELKFEVENDFLMQVALEKTIHEFKMWNSMSRKPGQPSAYMREVYQKVLNELRLTPGEKHPEIQAERHLGKHHQEAVSEGIHIRCGLLRVAQRVQQEGGLLLSCQPSGDRVLPRSGGGFACAVSKQDWSRAFLPTASVLPPSSCNADCSVRRTALI